MSVSGGERNDAVDHCLAGIDRLSHEVKDASSYIPAYDQRTYSQVPHTSSSQIRIPADDTRQSRLSRRSYKTFAIPSTLPKNSHSRPARKLPQYRHRMPQRLPNLRDFALRLLRRIRQTRTLRLHQHRSTSWKRRGNMRRWET